jgi:hypothetical protein
MSKSHRTCMCATRATNSRSMGYDTISKRAHMSPEDAATDAARDGVDAKLLAVDDEAGGRPLKTAGIATFARVTTFYLFPVGGMRQLCTCLVLWVIFLGNLSARVRTASSSPPRAKWTPRFKLLWRSPLRNPAS